MSLNFKILREDVARALREDIQEGDQSAALIPSESQARAEIISREPMLLCGQAWVNESFAQVDSEIIVEWRVEEGAWLAEPRTLCYLHGPCASLLTVERTALNFLQTLSGTATTTYHYLAALKGTQACLLDTRKTLPGLRYAQKYAVACAGGKNHRMGLYDAFLIKENHIKACGSITKAIQRARLQQPGLMVEVEVENFVELEEAFQAKPDRILLDNFSLVDLSKAVVLNQPYRIPLEASGGLGLEQLRQIAQTGVDYISVGALTKSVRAIDLSLLIKEML